MNVTESSVIDKYQIDPGASKNYNKELGQDQFLELMMQQLKNQDPMKPMDNGEFLGQMAQFSTVSGIEDMAKSMDSLAQTYAVGQTLQSAQLVGQEILVDAPTLSLDEGGSTGGRFDLESSSSDVTLSITDENGALVTQMPLGEFKAGRHDFSWNGKDSKGNQMPAGNYTASINVLNGDSYDSATVLSARIVDSVEFGSDGETTINTTLGDSLTMDDVRQIRQRTASSTNSNSNK